MNRREREVKERYESQGWRMLRNGAPDFVALKIDSEGIILDIRGVEVKPPNGKLTYEQGVYRKVFEKAKISYIVEVEK